MVGRAAAQTPTYEGKTVVALDYIPARQPLAAKDLKAAQGVHVGAALNPDDVASTIDRMFATGYYTDIRVDAEPRPGE